MSGICSEQQQDLEKDKKERPYFAIPMFAKLVKFGADGVNDYSEFEKLFATPEFEKGRFDLLFPHGRRLVGNQTGELSEPARVGLRRYAILSGATLRKKIAFETGIPSPAKTVERGGRNGIS